MAKTPAWQRAEGKNPEGGLNEKGRASLRAAGHDIKRPQPEGGSRKDSFCARMKGMKSKLTSSETANDPDSRINKSLRKWKCADGGFIPHEAEDKAHINFQYSKPGSNKTELGIEEPYFRRWLAENQIPFDPNEKKPDYDMRGYYRAAMAGDPIAATSINPNDQQRHFPDVWKTPMHESFSAQSQYATPNAPDWNEKDQLVDKSGRIVFDERMSRKDGGQADPYETMRRLIEEQQERQRREKDPMFSVQPEEYRKGNLGLGRYVLANGGRAHMALGGDPTALDTGNPVLQSPESVSPDISYINSLYQNILGRQGEQGGIDYWRNQLAQGNLDQGQVLQQFAGSKEFQGLYQQDPTKAVTSLYRTALGRDPEQAGLDYWVNQAKGGMGLDAMTQGFLGSREGQNVSDINQYYQDYTGNVATPEQIQAAKQQLGEGDDWTNFLEKTFPTKPVNDGSYDVAGGWQSKATQVPGSSADLMAKLGPLEQKYGLPQGYLMGMMGIESTYGQNQQTPGSSYSGAFQLSPSLIKQYNVSNPYDWTQSADAAAQYAAQNRDYFKKTVGRDPTPQELYGLHQQGNAFAYMAKSPDMNAAQVLRQAAPKTYRTLAAAQNAIRGNLPSDMRRQANTMSAQDFMNFYSNKYNQKLGGPDQLGQQAIASYYQPATVQTAAATGAQTATAPVDPRVIYNAQMEKYKVDKASYDNWLANYLAGEAMAGRPIVAPSSGGMQAPTMPVYNANLGQTLASQGAGGNIPAGTAAAPIASTGSAASSVGYQPPVLSWQPEGMSTYSAPNVAPSYYPVPDANGIGNGWGTNYSGGGGWAGGSGSTGYSAPSYGSSATPANFSGSVSTFSPGGQFADGGAVDPYDDVQKAAKGGAIWDKPRPKKLGKPEPLSSKEKASAKAAAKAAGRQYPNLIDNMRAARADGGEVDPYESVQRAAEGATPVVPPVSVTEHAMPSTPALDAYRGAINEAIPMPARALVSGMTGVHSPMTEKDLTPEDRAEIVRQTNRQQKINAFHEQAFADEPTTSPEAAKALQSFQDTRGKTSVTYDPSLRKTIYDPSQAGITQVASRAYNDPNYRVGTTLGSYNVYDTPKGRIVLDKYDFDMPNAASKNIPISASDFNQNFMQSLRMSIPQYAPNIIRPVAINLDAKPNRTYEYTGPAITTPRAPVSSDETRTPLPDWRNKVSSTTPGSITDLMPPRRPAGYADGGEVEGDVQFAFDDPYAKIQQAAKAKNRKHKRKL